VASLRASLRRSERGERGLFSITMADSARHSLTAGEWDPIQELLDNTDGIESTAKALPYV
jgi:hypothetical protein